MLALRDADIILNTQHCCETLRVLHTAIKRKHPNMLTKGVVMLYDNNQVHAVQDTVFYALEGAKLSFI
jgi:hypothetical protein